MRNAENTGEEVACEGAAAEGAGVVAATLISVTEAIGTKTEEEEAGEASEGGEEETELVYIPIGLHKCHGPDVDGLEHLVFIERHQFLPEPLRFTH